MNARGRGPRAQVMSCMRARVLARARVHTRAYWVRACAPGPSLGGPQVWGWGDNCSGQLGFETPREGYAAHPRRHRLACAPWRSRASALHVRRDRRACRHPPQAPPPQTHTVTQADNPLHPPSPAPDVPLSPHRQAPSPPPHLPSPREKTQRSGYTASLIVALARSLGPAHHLAVARPIHSSESSVRVCADASIRAFCLSRI